MKWMLAVLLLVIPAWDAHAQAFMNPVPGAPRGVTAFKHVAVVPLDRERVLVDQTVLVRDGWIAQIGPAAQVKIPAGANHIDGRGKYLMPGLSDMHLHVPLFPRMEHWPVEAPYSPELITETEQLLLMALANGVTTVRIMNGRPSILPLRERAAKGELWSPRIVAASPTMYGTGFTPDSAILHVKAAKAAGYDLIKMYRGQPTETGGPGWWDSLVVTARRIGMPIAGHVPDPGNGTTQLEVAIRAGYRSVEHLYGVGAYLYHRNPAFAEAYGRLFLQSQPQTNMTWPWSAVEDTSLRVLAGELRRGGVWTCPTLAVQMPFPRSYQKQTWPELRRFVKGVIASVPTQSLVNEDSLTATVMAQMAMDPKVKLRRQVVKGLYEAGAGILLGTDAAWAGLLPGFGVHHELAELVAAGLKPYDALVVGTRNTAEFLGVSDNVGTVTIGKRADLVLLDGNPLESIHHTRELAGVMLGGRWLGRAELDARLQKLEGMLGD